MENSEEFDYEVELSAFDESINEIKTEMEELQGLRVALQIEIANNQKNEEAQKQQEIE